MRRTVGTLSLLMVTLAMLSCNPLKLNTEEAMAESEKNSKALLMAAKSGDHLLVIEILAHANAALEKGPPVGFRVNVDIRDEEGWTPLMWATKHNFYNIAKELIDAGASPDIRSEDGMSALIIAIKNNQMKLFEMMLDKSNNMNMRDGDGMTPLMHAAASNNIAALEKLLEMDVDQGICDNRGQNALQIAGHRGNSRAVELLMGDGFGIQ